MQRSIMMICFLAMPVLASAQTCLTDSISASTPDDRFQDNGDNTVTDLVSGLMWKKCLEGQSGADCTDGSATAHTWQGALERPGAVNDAGGFAGYSDWRLPNIKELVSIVEEQCYSPAISLNRFPNQLPSAVWSASPYAYISLNAWVVDFGIGVSSNEDRSNYNSVRLVRGGQ